MMTLSRPWPSSLVWIAVSFTFCNADVVPSTLPLSEPFTGYSVQIFPGNFFQSELNTSWGPLLDRLGAQATALTAPNNADLFNSTPSTTAADFLATLQAARTGCNLPLGITPAVVQVMNNAIYSSFKEWNGPYVFEAGIYGSAPDPEVTFELLASDGAEKVASVDACPAGPESSAETDATAIVTEDDVFWDDLKKRSLAGDFTHYHEWRILQALKKREGENEKPRKGIDTCGFY